MRAWVVLSALVSAACLSDLIPEVGALKVSPSTAGDGLSEGGQNNSGGSGTDSDGGGKADGGSTGDGGKPDACVAKGYVVPLPSDKGCMNVDSDPCTDVSFKQDIAPVLFGCSCHNRNETEQPGIVEVGFVMVKLGETGVDHEELRKGGDNTGEKVIVELDPCSSIILEKLQADPPSFGISGVRMPKGKERLSKETLTLISDWIVEGARAN